MLRFHRSLMAFHHRLGKRVEPLHQSPHRHLHSNHSLSPTHSQIQYPLLTPLVHLSPRLMNKKMPIVELEQPNCCCVKFAAPTAVLEDVCVVLYLAQYACVLHLVVK